MRACEQCGDYTASLVTVERKTSRGNVRLQVCRSCAGSKAKAMPDLLSGVMNKIWRGKR